MTTTKNSAMLQLYWDHAMRCVPKAPWNPIAGAKPNGWIRDIVVDVDDLYIGGYFTNLGIEDPGSEISYLAKFDGTSWQDMGTDQLTLNGGYIEHIVKYPDGKIIIYAPGLSQVNSQPANEMAWYDGITWHPITTPTYPGLTVFDFVLKGNDLYIIGQLDGTSDGSTQIQQWNGSGFEIPTWVSNIPHYSNDFIYSAIVFNNAVVFSGAWWTDPTRYKLLYYEDNTPTFVSPTNYLYDTIEIMQQYNGTILAKRSGQFITFNSSTNTWEDFTPQFSNAGVIVEDTVFHNGELYAAGGNIRNSGVGYYDGEFIAKTDGIQSEWELLEGNTPYYVNSTQNSVFKVDVYQGNIIIGGNLGYDNIIGAPIRNLAIYTP